jgi:hypothetical protein
VKKKTEDLLAMGAASTPSAKTRRPNLVSLTIPNSMFVWMKAWGLNYFTSVSQTCTTLEVNLEDNQVAFRC